MEKACVFFFKGCFFFGLTFWIFCFFFGKWGVPFLFFSKELDVFGLSGRTPLHVTAMVGHRSMAELLLANGAEVDATDDGHGTPLHAAALNGRHAVAELLLAQGAGVHVADSNGQSLSRRFCWRGTKLSTCFNMFQPNLG